MYTTIIEGKGLLPVNEGNSMRNVTIKLPENKILEIPAGTKAGKIFSTHLIIDPTNPPTAALVNNKATSLSYTIEVNSELIPICKNSLYGRILFRRSLCFLLTIASRKIFPERRLVIGHSLGDGYYYHYDDYQIIPETELNKLSSCMDKIVKKETPIERKVISYQEALNYFKEMNQTDTALLLKYRNESKIPVNVCEDYMDLFYGPLVPNSKYLTPFCLKKYDPGFLLRFPVSEETDTISEFVDSPSLFSIYQEYKAWGKILSIDSVGRLNEIIDSGEIKNFIRVAEALHNKKIAEIADQINNKRDSVKVILIAGPSSSGKTTFTKKLSIQLRVLGFKPVSISIDDYFVSRDKTPKDDKGNYDFEAIEAIDIDLLNLHLIDLFKGGRVEIPVFDFKTGKRKKKGKPLELADNSVLIMEGIHGLNDRLTPLVENERKYKIYVSALTQLNLDDHNRISTTDNRLLRRLVRDYQFRGHNALSTLKRWPSVRRGEDKNIFPFQDNADSVFNSAVDYELAVLKVFAEPILKTVKPCHGVYNKAIELLSFLNNFAPVSSKYIPDDSILREFIGGSWFKY